MSGGTPFLSLEARGDGTIAATGHKHFAVNRGPESGNRPTGPGSIARSSWEWDGEILTARTSESGLVPLYYCSDGGQIAISPSLLFLRENYSAGPLDWPAITIALTIGGYISADTPFEDLKALPLNSTLSWTAGRLSVDRRRIEAPLLDLDYETALDGYASAMRSAMQRTLPSGSFGMGLSGGRDSRHIFLELAELGRWPTRTVTSGHYLRSSGSDMSVAIELASDLDVPIIQVTPGRDRVAAEIEKNLRTEFQTLSHSWAIPLADELSTIPVIFDGMNGGALFGRSRVVGELRAEYGPSLPDKPMVVDRALASLFDRPVASVREMMTDGVLSNEVVYEARERMQESLNWIRDYPNPAQAFQHYNRTARDIALFTYGLIGSDQVICPLDDPEVVRFALGLPWNVSSVHDLQNDALRRTYPRYAAVPFAEEILSSSRAAKWDVEVEAASLLPIVDSIQRSGTPIVGPSTLESLASGSGRMKDVQVVTYLSQLLSWDQQRGEATSQSGLRRRDPV